MGDKYGLAKKATAIAVKVLNDGGSGTTAYVFYFIIRNVRYVSACILLQRSDFWHPMGSKPAYFIRKKISCQVSY